MYESNGPDVKIRGTASHVAEKYLQLARDAQSSGDPVAAENYYQHAEHYFGEQPHIGGEPFAPREPQPYHPREQHHHQSQHYQPQQHQQHFQPRSQHSNSENQGDVDRLPSFITGNQPQQHQQPAQGQGSNGPHNSAHSGPPDNQRGQNGPNGYDGPQDRFPLHRRRRRHRGGGGPREHSMDHSIQGGDGPSGSHSGDE
jgi:hypothetical protein